MIPNDGSIRNLDPKTLVLPDRPSRRVRTGAEWDKLTESIRVHGVLQPVIARPLPDGRTQVVSGVGRVVVARKLGLGTVPVLIKPLSDEEAVLLAGDDNRSQGAWHFLNDILECLELRRLDPNKWSIRALAKRFNVGHSQPHLWVQIGSKLPPDAMECAIKIANRGPQKVFSVRNSGQEIRNFANFRGPGRPRKDAPPPAHYWTLTLDMLDRASGLGPKAMDFLLFCMSRRLEGADVASAEEWAQKHDDLSGWSPIPATPPPAQILANVPSPAAAAPPPPQAAPRPPAPAPVAAAPAPILTPQVAPNRKLDEFLAQVSKNLPPLSAVGAPLPVPAPGPTAVSALSAKQKLHALLAQASKNLPPLSALGAPPPAPAPGPTVAATLTAKQKLHALLAQAGKSLPPLSVAPATSPASPAPIAGPAPSVSGQAPAPEPDKWKRIDRWICVGLMLAFDVAFWFVSRNDDLLQRIIVGLTTVPLTIIGTCWLLELDKLVTRLSERIARLRGTKPAEWGRALWARVKQGWQMHPCWMISGALALIVTIGLWTFSPALVWILWGLALLSALVWTIEERGRTIPVRP